MIIYSAEGRFVVPRQDGRERRAGADDLRQRRVADVVVMLAVFDQMPHRGQDTQGEIMLQPPQ